MKRSLRVVGILAFTGAVVVFALWSARTPSAKHSGHETLEGTIKSSITTPILFAKAHSIGGIGVLLESNSLTDGSRVQELVDGSQPLESASGYHAHDAEMLPPGLYSASPYSCLIEVPTSVDDAFLRQPPISSEFAMRYCEPPLRLEPVR